MAKIKEIIAEVNDNIPNAFKDERKLAWIAELDGRIAADVFLMGIEDVQQLQYKYPEDLESEPLVRFPHDRLYPLWLEAQIDFANREADKYQNSMAMYNAAYSSFVRWVAQTYDPAQGYKHIEGG